MTELARLGASTGVIVVGGGGHARVILDTLLAMDCPVVGFTDPRKPELPMPVPWLGGDQEIPRLLSLGHHAAIVALGGNTQRARVSTALRSLGVRFVNAVHPSAIVAPSVELGSGVAIMAGVVINARTRVGDDVIVNTGATVDHDCVLESGCHIAPGSHLSGYVTIGPRVLVGIGSVVGRGEPISIGADATVGAGTVVIRPVPPDHIAIGVPAIARPRPQGHSD